MVRTSLFVIAVALLGSGIARAEPRVSTGVGASLKLEGGYIGYTFDLYVAWRWARSWAVVAHVGRGALALDPADRMELESYVLEGGAGVLYRRCGRVGCWGTRMSGGVQRQRGRYSDRDFEDPQIEWLERRDSVFADARLLGQLFLHPRSDISLDAGLALRGHRIVAYQNTLDSDKPHDRAWLGVVLSAGLSGHY